MPHPRISIQPVWLHTGWGGQTGHGDGETRLVPTRVVALARERVVCVSAGVEHSLVLVQRGAVFIFGCDGDGRLGHGDHVDRSTPKWVEGLAKERVVAVAAGGYHSMAAMADAEGGGQ